MATGLPLITIKQGQLKGREFITDSRFIYYGFQGIPYAQSPVGELRFQSPKPPQPWVGILDATKEGNQSCQWNSLKNEFLGDEDCLFLNVYIPKLPTSNRVPLPVMVYFHGGGFVMWSGSSEMYGPDFLVEQNVVIVTVNYRLGPLGFLSLENEEVPGNFGLKDQVAALQWVRDNIASFGGDNNSVTIFGESAGAASVHYHIMSPLSKGLFHRAIAMSGTAFNPWALQYRPQEKALSLCSILEHPTNDLSDAAQFLKSVPAMDLVKANLKVTCPAQKRGFGITCLMVPCIEKEVSDQDAFLTEDVENLMKEGKFNDVPLIIGFNSDEGLFTRKEIDLKAVTMDEIKEDPERVLPYDILEYQTEHVSTIYEKVKDFYLKKHSDSEEEVVQYTVMKSDMEFIYGVHKFAKIYSEMSKNLLYYYRFSFAEMGVFKMVLGVTQPGCCHADDLAYLFKINMANIPVEKDSNIDITRRRLVKMWTDFAKTSNPTPEITDIISTKWEPLAKDEKFRYLEINTDLSMQDCVEIGRMSFLEELFGNNEQTVSEYEVTRL